jgi:cation transport ATPase
MIEFILFAALITIYLGQSLFEHLNLIRYMPILTFLVMMILDIINEQITLELTVCYIIITFVALNILTIKRYQHKKIYDKKNRAFILLKKILFMLVLVILLKPVILISWNEVRVESVNETVLPIFSVLAAFMILIFYINTHNEND